MIGATDVRVGERQAERVIFRRLELYFATLTVLGAFVLAIGNDGAVIPMIAIFFAIVGYVFVDLLKFFSLPPTAAYIAMALAAVRVREARRLADRTICLICRQTPAKRPT
jgi:hypothetical protein